MSKTWFVGDPHFGHRNILKFDPPRPFIDVEHMDNTIIENFNSTVEDGDLVFWMGDMFFCNAERMNYISKRLKLDTTRNIVIRGNHDGGTTNNKFRTLGFMPVKMYYYAGMMLTHQPMTPENIAWVKLHNPAFIGNSHAHTHGSDTGLDPSRWQCTSLENIDYKPISWSSLRDRFVEGRAHDWTTPDSDLAYFKTGDHLRKR